MSQPQVGKTIILIWPLLMALALIMAGNGLQGTLLGLRASLEEFPVSAVGSVMSLYYVGFLVGCYLVPRMISAVGHIRVFAGLASLASTTILIHGVFMDLWVWSFVRLLSGLSFAGLFIVSESWLNNIATNKLRGQIFSFYLFVIHGGLFSGQFLVALAPPGDIDLFILISILVSLSLMPITLANKPAPGYEKPETLSFKKIFKKSPLAPIGVFATGICAGTILSMGVIYARDTGYSDEQAAYFVASYILGSTIIPLIVGWLSDRIDRRNVIIGTVFCAFICSIFAHDSPYLLVLIFLFGGLTASLYSVSIALLNDRIKPEQMVSATTSLILMNAMGAILGPVSAGIALQYDVSAFFMAISIVLFIVLTIGCYRGVVGDPIDVEEQSDFVIIPTRSAPSVMQISEDE